MTETILFVDDEPNVLAAFRRQLHTQFQIETASSGQEALDLIATGEPFAVIVSDLRMPMLDGIQFLSETRKLSPDSIRILLTGHADLSTAVDAVNKGQIFRFLMKPCSPDELSQSLKAGLEQYRLVTAERELLEKTLSRSVKLLTDMLSFVNPIAFGRALRLRRIVGQITASMKLLGGWQFELAAMLSQTGCVALPSDLLEKASRGEPLTKNEQSVYASHPMIGHRLLEGIPRLEPIASMVKDQNRPYASYASQPYSYKTQDIDLGAQLLKAVVDYDHLRQGGLSHAEAISAMRGDPDTYNPEIVDALAECKIDRNDWVTQVVVADAVKPGMILDEDLYAKDGKLLAPKGLEITAPVLEQIALVVKGVGIVEPFRVLASSVKSVVPAE